MAESSPTNISNLFLEDGIPIPYLPIVVSSVYSGVSFGLPFFVVGFLFWCCKTFINYHVKRCPHCTSPRSIRARCKNSTIGRMTKFCDVVEQFTAWLLVDLFHTPKVEKVLIRGKLRLTVLNQQVQTDIICGISWTFVWISTLFCSYIAKFLLDIFVKITTTCISEGDFGFTAICYADVHVSYQINCTTWNENHELLQETGLYCVSLYYQFLMSLVELAGLYSLQLTIIQITLSILGKISSCKRCGLFFTFLTLNIFLMLPMLIAGIEVGNPKLYLDIPFKPFPAMNTLIGSFTLSSYLFLSIYHNTNPHSRLKGITSMPNMTHDCQCNRVMEKTKEEQIDGETDTKEGRNTWHDSKDEKSSETMQGEDVVIVEIHDYTTEEACTTREHNGEGLLEGHGNIQMELRRGCSATRDSIYT